MSDRQDLSAALKKMREAEGKAAKDKLVWHTLQQTIGDDIHAMASKLSEELKEDQAEQGAERPICGKMMAVEILAKIGMLLNEKEE
jgi:hypothetical protein